MVRAAIAAAALVATTATAVNTHHHKHRELAENYARLQWERAIEERGLVYKYTETETFTELVLVTVMMDPPQDGAPTGIFFETSSSSTQEPTPAPPTPTTPTTPTTQPVETQQPKPVFENPAAKPPSEVPAGAPAGTPAEAPVGNPAQTGTEAPIEAPAKPSSIPSPPSGGSRLPCKRGIAYENSNIASLFTSSGSICWGYNWGSSGYLGDYAVYVPMLWGMASWTWNTFDMNMATQIQNNPNLHYIFSFNEPDLFGQARDLIPTAEDAARLHIERLAPYFNQGYAVGAPAVTSNVKDPSMSLTYLERFINVCNSFAGGSCPISFINVHYYEEHVCDISGLTSFIEQVASRFPGYSIWVTEYQLNTGACSRSDKKDFIDSASEYLDENSRIEAYAYFYADGELTEGGGSAFSDLGQAYVSS